jgi:hypothetical protein
VLAWKEDGARCTPSWPQLDPADERGVGHLMQIAVDLGRATRPDLEICGEHGGDPRSIDCCHRLGLDYLSCSPFRIPVARLAAAHATLATASAPRAGPPPTRGAPATITSSSTAPGWFATGIPTEAGSAPIAGTLCAAPTVCRKICEPGRLSSGDACLHRFNDARRKAVLRPSIQQALLALSVAEQHVDELLRSLEANVVEIHSDAELEEILSNHAVLAQQRGRLAVVDVGKGGEHEPFLCLHVVEQLVFELAPQGGDIRSGVRLHRCEQTSDLVAELLVTAHHVRVQRGILARRR